MLSEEIMFTLSVSREYCPDFQPNFLALVEEESDFHWHGVVVEFIVNWQPRRSSGSGCVHVSNTSSISGKHFWSFLPHPLFRH